MTINQNDSDFARTAEKILREIKTADLAGVLDILDDGLTRLTSRSPSRDGAIAGTIYAAATVAIVRELERRENPNGDVQ